MSEVGGPYTCGHNLLTQMLFFILEVEICSGSTGSNRFRKFLTFWTSNWTLGSIQGASQPLNRTSGPVQVRFRFSSGSEPDRGNTTLVLRLDRR
jgi:hypothetical protein